MLGIQTRLRLTPAQDALLADTLGIMATLARTAYQRVATEKLAADRKAVYAWATGKGLTAHQANSLATQVEQWRATDQATLKYRLESVRLRIDALERTVKSLDARLNAPSKKAKTFLSPTARARLTAIRFQKHRSLVNLRVTLAQLETQQATGQFHRVFGSRRLLSQRQRLDAPDSPWTEATWRQEWERKRQGRITLIGDARHTAGNQSAQVILETTLKDGTAVPTGKATLHLRLTEQQASARLVAAANAQGIPVDQVTGRMAYKRLAVPVTLPLSHAHQLHRAQTLGLPITVTLSRQPTPKGKAQQRTFSRGPGQKHVKRRVNAHTENQALPEIGTCLHLAFDLPPAPVIASRHQGTLGVDLNSWGLSYAGVDSQGQLLTFVDPVTGEKRPLKGDIVLPLRGMSSQQAKHCIRQACVTLCALAERHRLAIAIEDLDFSRKKARLREMPKCYARMLSRLTTAGFADALLSRCRKVGIAFHRVSPAWTSVAGFAKYGMSLSLSPDQAGAFAIGRAGVLAKGKPSNPLPTHSQTGKKLSPKFVRELAERQASRVLYYSESVRFAKPLPDVVRQRMSVGQRGLSWRSVQKALGHRKAWPQQWARPTMSATPVSIQERSRSRPRRETTPAVCDRPVRPLATSRSAPVKRQRLKHVQASTA